LQPAGASGGGGAGHEYLEPVALNPSYASPEHEYQQPVSLNPNYASPGELDAAPASRARAHTAYACKYRGADGRACRNKAAAGGGGGGGGAQPFCRGHTCPAAGCTAPKRSSASHCPDHAPAAGTKKKAGKKPQRGKQASVYLGFNGTSGGGGGGGDDDSTAA